MKRSKKRSYRRRSHKKWLATALLLALMIAVGIFYATDYQKRLLYEQYPLRYEQEIRVNARQFGLEAWHVAAVVRCESSFDVKATSSVGARGLMQIMPDTGKWIAHKLDEDDIYTDDRLYEPFTNLRYGCWYLNWLMKRFSGDRTLVTAAYHAGHGKVDEWLKNPEYSPDGTTLALIPYDSTRAYVKRVLNACEKYQELYDFDEEAA